jgi:hypothetical protein
MFNNNQSALAICTLDLTFGGVGCANDDGPALGIWIMAEGASAAVGERIARKTGISEHPLP